MTVLGNTGSLARTGYTFSGWNTAAGGGGTNYAAGATFTISADTTLYAQWTATPTPTSANGGGRSAGTFYWAYTGNTEEYGYTGPAPYSVNVQSKYNDCSHYAADHCYGYGHTNPRNH